MKAVGYQRCLPATDPQALIDFELPAPEPGPHDLRVRVEAVSVNPLDTRIRRTVAPADGETKVLGWDAAGTVDTVGSAVTLFRPGDAVYYAGSNVRPGCNAELHLVDERIVGHRPASIGAAAAAALPLTSITAWELLFERLGMRPGKRATGESLLIVAAAGGVGSMLVQLARRLTAARVIATASRPDSARWITELGAEHVLDHSRPLKPQLQMLGIDAVSHVASLRGTHERLAELVEILRPGGRLGLIDDPPGPVDIRLLKPKCISLHYEAMFMRSRLNLPDMIEQHRLLDEVSALVDAGVLRSTMTAHGGPIDAAHLRAAHAAVESGRMLGKVVLGIP